MEQPQSNDSKQPVQIKQRVIGAIVLVSLGVIFIPMLLNSERSMDDGMPVFGSNIPAKPEYLSKKNKVSSAPKSSAIIIKSQADFDSRVIIDEHSAVTEPEKNSPSTSFANVNSKNKNTPSVKPGQAKVAQKKAHGKKIILAKIRPAAKKPAKAWAIQVGSFSERKNAFKLRDKLRRKKFAAFVESVRTSKGQVYRVRVGPEIKREQAVKLQKKLVAELKIKGLVIAHP